LSDTVLLDRLGVMCSEAFVAGVAKGLDDARKEVDEAMATGRRGTRKWRGKGWCVLI
jgi:hypothetical protein